jgi:hypothetical protein
MSSLKTSALTVLALACAPVSQASAVVPWIAWVAARHVVGAVAHAATWPLAVASSAASVAQPPGYWYPSDPAYSAPAYYPAQAPGYYAPTPSYYAPMAPYYAPPSAAYAPVGSYAPARAYAPAPVYRPAYAPPVAVRGYASPGRYGTVPSYGYRAPARTYFHAPARRPAYRGSYAGGGYYAGRPSYYGR